MSVHAIDTERLKAVIAHDVLNLYVKCEEYVRLFGMGPKNVDILERAAPKFFRVYQRAAWCDLVTDLARITGPKTTGQGPRLKQNLTIGRLPDLVDPMFRAEIEAAVGFATEKSMFVVEARNQILAHRDLTVALSSNAGGIRRGNSHEMRDAVYSVKEAVEAALPGFTAWEHSSRIPGGGAHLLELLEFALEQKANQKE